MAKVRIGERYRLFTAGPVSCFPEVLEAMSSQMFSHRSIEYQEIHMETINLLKWFLDTRQHVILMPSSGSGLMEASIRNGVSRGGRVLVTIIGAFGDRYAEVVEANGRRALRLRSRLGEPVDPDKLDKVLGENPEVEAVTITHNETSTGVLNPLRELCRVVRRHGKLVFVDAVSSMGATEIRVDEWGIDFIFSSSQKAFGIPPGLAFAAFSERFLEKAYNVDDRGWYFDIPYLTRYLSERKGTPMTPPMPQIFGLNIILKKIREKGIDKWIDMYRVRAERIRRGVEGLGLRILARRGYESPTITVVYAPRGVSGIEIYNEMRRRGFELAKGYGPLREETFRIGHMGYITDQEIDDMLKALGEVIGG